MNYFKILGYLLIIMLSGKLMAQSDTIIYKNKEKLLCKVIEISETDIRFKKETNPMGPIYSVDRNKISEIRFSNGQVEQIVQDEMSANQSQEILDKRRVIKFEPFGLVGGRVVLGYEKVLKVGINLEVKAGYVNSSIGYKGYTNYFTQGAFIKPGIKFLLGTDYYYKGVKYTHPLRGHYIRFDGLFSFFTIHDIQANIYNPVYGYQVYNGKTDQREIAYGMLINYGRQIILGNIVTLDYFVGVGIAGHSTSYTDNSVAVYRNYDLTNNRYFSHTQIGSLPIAFNGGLALGILMR
jgi:hypothetical protein